MRLVAVKRISAQIPRGMVFDEPNAKRARVWIAIKAAKVAPDEPQPAEPSPVVTEPDAATAAPRRGGYRRSVRSEAPGA